jgi:SAM-dependent methyltransferase
VSRWRERRQDGDAVEILEFRCNICGTRSEARRATLERESRSCDTCGSTMRWRSIIHLLSLALFEKSRAIADFPTDHGVRGIGLSDWPGYAARLPSRLDYVNTFLDADPQLDIAEFHPKLEGQLDFILSSDVFEHVPPPVHRAFVNSRRMLRPGGVLVLTVPYHDDRATKEHFPNLHDFRVETREGKRVLVNITPGGDREEFEDLVFHGDTASTNGSLEMRDFGEADIVEHLHEAGFTDIHIHREPALEHGIEWRVPWSLPISARAA